MRFLGDTDSVEASDRLWADFTGGYAWDVGANCGQSIPIIASRFWKVTSFEPCPCSYGYAVKAYSGADIRPIALSDHDGILQLAALPGVQAETGQLVTPGTMGMEWQPTDWSTVTLVTVNCRAADSLAGEIGTPDFIKVDTEGHEMSVLLGASRILTEGRTSLSNSTPRSCRKAAPRCSGRQATKWR